MPSGYSGTPLIKKLGIKPGKSILLVNEPDHYLDLLGPLPDAITIINDGSADSVDFIHLFVADEKTLHNDFPPLKSKLDKNGMIWVSWIKKSSKMGDRYKREWRAGFGVADWVGGYKNLCGG